MAQLDWHWWRQEAPGILAGAALLLLVAFFFRWLPDRPADDRPLSGRILGFYGHLEQGQFRNVVRATVRLRDGRNVMVQMPRSGRGAHCRAGDEVKLVQSGIIFRAVGQGCPRR